MSYSNHKMHLHIEQNGMKKKLFTYFLFSALLSLLKLNVALVALFSNLLSLINLWDLNINKFWL